MTSSADDGGGAGLAVEARRRLGPAPEQGTWPLVSVIVLNRDGGELLERLIAGLRECTDYPELELIVVDNASTDDSLDRLRRIEAPFSISILTNAHNESFSDGCNRGADVATGELLLFLNNDVVPFERGWLRELVSCLLHHAAGAACSTLVEPAVDAKHGYLVEQRGHWVGEVDGMLVPVYRDRGDDVLGEPLWQDLEVVLAAAACLLLDRTAFDAVDGFTRGYWYGGEDSDIALKLRERGIGVVCSGRSLVAHSPNSSLSTVDPRLRSEWVRGNRRLFMERWGPRIRREYELDRLQGGGLWAEPGPVGPSSWGSTPEEVEALGFCLKSAALPPRPGEAPPIEEVVIALRERGHRAAALRAGMVDDLAALDYDVVVHDGSVGRYAPTPARLNLLWLAAEAAPRPPLETAGYDLVLRGNAQRSTRSAEACADLLVEQSETLAWRLSFETRVSPEA